MPTPATAIDGDYAVRKLLSPGTVITYPFLNAPIKDTTTKFFERLYEIDRQSYTPFADGSTLPDEGDENGADATAYILREDPSTVADGGAATTRCLFGYVPIDQIRYSNESISKPDPSTVAGARGDFLYADSTLATIYTAAELLGYLWAKNNKIYGPLATTTSANNGGNTDVTWTAHGLAGTETICVRGVLTGSRYALFASGTYTIVNANTIKLTGVNYGTSVIQCGKYYRAYTAGTGVVRTRNTQKFYRDSSLIAKPTVLLADLDFCTAAVAALTGYTDYRATQPEAWNGTSLTMIEIVAMNLADL